MKSDEHPLDGEPALQRHRPALADIGATKRPLRADLAYGFLRSGATVLDEDGYAGLAKGCPGAAWSVLGER